MLLASPWNSHKQVGPPTLRVILHCEESQRDQRSPGAVSPIQEDILAAEVLAHVRARTRTLSVQSRYVYESLLDKDGRRDLDKVLQGVRIT